MRLLYGCIVSIIFLRMCVTKLPVPVIYEAREVAHKGGIEDPLVCVILVIAAVVIAGSLQVPRDRSACACEQECRHVSTERMQFLSAPFTSACVVGTSAYIV